MRSSRLRPMLAVTRGLDCHGHGGRAGGGRDTGAGRSPRLDSEKGSEGTRRAPSAASAPRRPPRPASAGGGRRPAATAKGGPFALLPSLVAAVIRRTRASPFGRVFITLTTDAAQGQPCRSRSARGHAHPVGACPVSSREGTGDPLPSKRPKAMRDTSAPSSATCLPRKPAEKGDSDRPPAPAAATRMSRCRAPPCCRPLHHMLVTTRNRSQPSMPACNR